MSDRVEVKVHNKCVFATGLIICAVAVAITAIGILQVQVPIYDKLIEAKQYSFESLQFNMALMAVFATVVFVFGAAMSFRGINPPKNDMNSETDITKMGSTSEVTKLCDAALRLEQRIGEGVKVYVYSQSECGRRGETTTYVFGSIEDAPFSAAQQTTCSSQQETESSFALQARALARNLSLRMAERLKHSLGDEETAIITVMRGGMLMYSPFCDSFNKSHFGFVAPDDTGKAIRGVRGPVFADMNFKNIIILDAAVKTGNTITLVSEYLDQENVKAERKCVCALSALPDGAETLKGAGWELVLPSAEDLKLYGIVPALTKWDAGDVVENPLC